MLWLEKKKYALLAMLTKCHLKEKHFKHNMAPSIKEIIWHFGKYTWWENWYLSHICAPSMRLEPELEAEKNKCQYSHSSHVGVCMGRYQRNIKYYILNSDSFFPKCCVFFSSFSEFCVLRFKHNLSSERVCNHTLHCGGVKLVNIFKLCKSLFFPKLSQSVIFYTAYP